MGLLALKRLYNIQLLAPFWPKLELQKLQSTQVTSDLTEYDPLMRDRLGGGSAIPLGLHLNMSGLAEVWDSARGVCDETVKSLYVLFGEPNYPQESTIH